MNVPLLDLRAQYATIRTEIQSALNEILESQVFILGPEVQALEAEIAAFCGTRFAIGVSSGTDALLIALMAARIGQGDEVITTPYTFFATAGSIARVGATPVFVDIEPATYNLNPALIEARITEKTKAIIPVHLYGQCADMQPILDVARAHKLLVIEDAAQAIGAEYAGMPDKKRSCAGNLGDCGCFSFFPSKNLGAFGDGGMVVTNSAEFAHLVTKLRTHGGQDKYRHDMIGMNGRLDALQAAVLRVKLKYLDGWSAKRRENAAYYDQAFASLEQVTPPYRVPGGTHIYNQYVIRVPRRDELQVHLTQCGIGHAIYYPIPLHLQACFAYLGYQAGDLPESEQAARETVALPVYPELTREQQDAVIQTITQFFRG